MTDVSQSWPEFTGEAVDENAPKTVGFKLNGVAFPCLSEPPGAAWRHLTGANAISSGAAISFIESCLASDTDVEAFKLAIDSKQQLVRGELLGQIMLALINQYSQSDEDDASASNQNGSLTVVP